MNEDAKKKRNKLRAKVKASQPIGQIKFTLPADKARKSREVTQTVYAKEVKPYANFYSLRIRFA